MHTCINAKYSHKYVNKQIHKYNKQMYKHIYIYIHEHKYKCGIIQSVNNKNLNKYFLYFKVNRYL